MRSVLLVGSMPFRDEEDCMRRALDEVGPYLLSLPDGEVGERTPVYPEGARNAWVLRAIDILYGDRESWRVIKDPVRARNGLPEDYTCLHQLEPVISPEEVPDRLRFHYDELFQQYYPIFQRLRDERGLRGLRYQWGIPTGMALGFAFPNPADRVRFRGAFNTVLAREVNAILDLAGDDVVIQLELPAEVLTAYMEPAAMAQLSVASVRDLVEKIRPGARIGLHLCVGDMQNRALMQPKSLETMVKLSNLLVESWPEGRVLEYMHYPLAAGNLPAPANPRFYEPLADIRLPAGTRFFGGFVHEALSFEENAEVLSNLEAVRGEEVGVACSCGMGRRTQEVGEELLRLMAQLAAAPRQPRRVIPERPAVRVAAGR